MTFRVRYKVYSVAEPDRENWTSIDEFRIAVDPNSNKSLSTAIQDATSIYKEGRAWSLEDNIPYLTVDYKSETDYMSSVAKYQSDIAAAGTAKTVRWECVALTEF